MAARLFCPETDWRLSAGEFQVSWSAAGLQPFGLPGLRQFSCEPVPNRVQDDFLNELIQPSQILLGKERFTDIDTEIHRIVPDYRMLPGRAGRG